MFEIFSKRSEKERLLVHRELSLKAIQHLDANALSLANCCALNNSQAIHFIGAICRRVMEAQDGTWAVCLTRLAALQG